jgi:uncharacterized protein YyaL (SSP411 family)
VANRLANEASPYLRQHADNPVEWWPWSDEAFEEARRRDVPVLLSVGYSACHWCHVMAHESFEDDATAALMNDAFVNIKVDREERPDVDAIYMEAVQAMTGHGGWPMTVFMTADGEPFFGGTYFPKQRRQGMPAFTELLSAIDDAWTTRRDELLEQAGKLADAIRTSTSFGATDGVPDRALLDTAAAAVLASIDLERGGVGRAPKFPQTMSLDLLLRMHARTGDPALLDAVQVSLDAMASGGIYDHLGGGFARYSVDDVWLVPHFEKMLYDQALLVRVYLHAWQVTGEARYLQVVDETITYVLRDLRHRDGGLCSAEDADSEGEEGKFYVWSLDEVREVCGDDAPAAIKWWGVSEQGNFAEPERLSERGQGSNILARWSRGDLLRPEAVERARAALFARREGRVRPGLDDKVLTEWNALFVASLAEAATATGRTDWRDAAVRTAEFLFEHLRGDGGRWMRSWQEDAGARHLAYAADHAALVDACTRLYECTGDARWLDRANEVVRELLARFWDDAGGGLFTTGNDAEKLVARQKDLVDGATPSANSTAATALLRLASLTGDDALEARAATMLGLVGDAPARHPTAFAQLLAAADLAVGPRAEIVVTGDRPDLVGEVTRRYLPRAVLAWGTALDSPLWEGRDEGLAYVCEAFACKQPVSTVAELSVQLDEIS